MSFAQLWLVIHRVAALLRDERGSLVLVVSCIVLDVSYGAFNALTFSKLVDLGVIAHDGVRFAWLLGVLGAAMLVAVSGGLFRDWLLARMGARVARRLREEMYAKLVGPSGADLAHGARADVLYRFSNDVLAIENTIAGVFPALVRALIAIGINALVLARERWWFAVISIVLSLLALVAPRLLARRSMEATRLRREAEQGLLGEVGVALQATDVVRVLGLGDSMVSKFVDRCGEVFRRNVRSTFLGFAMTRGSAIGMNIAEVLALGIFGAMAVGGHVTPGRFVALHALFMELALAFLALTQLTPGFVDAHVSFERLRLLRDLDAAESEKGEIAGPFAKDIALSHVDVLYPDGKRGLADVSLVLRKGEMVAVVGPSGSGKSTLARVVLGLAKTGKGEITFDGVPFSHLALPTVRAQMGAVFQETVLFDCSIEENIRLGASSATSSDVQRAIDAAGLSSMVNRPSFAPLREVGEGGVALSGGQRQRIGFARALVRDPPILVLDEPTSQLDPGNAQDITETIRAEAAHRTVLVITHDPRLAKRADRILVMDDGRLVAEGAHEDLLVTSPLYRSLVEAAGPSGLVAD